MGAKNGHHNDRVTTLDQVVPENGKHEESDAEHTKKASARFRSGKNSAHSGTWSMTFTKSMSNSGHMQLGRKFLTEIGDLAHKADRGTRAAGHLVVGSTYNAAQTAVGKVLSHDSDEEEVHRSPLRGLASACYDDMESIRKQLDQLNERQANHGKWVILPGGRNLTYWRSFMMIIVLTAVSMAPFELAYDWWTPTFTWKFIGKLVDALCIFDMFVNCFIGYVKRGRLITDHWKILRHYLKTWFLIDLLSNFPWDLALGDAGKSRKIVKFMKLPKIIRIVRLLRVVREEAHFFGPIFTFAFLVIVAHYCSCIWASLLIDCNSGWLDNNEAGSETPCPDVARAYMEGFSVGMASLTGSDSWMRFAMMQSSETAFSWENHSGPFVDLAAASMCAFGLCTVALLFGNIAKAIERKDSHSQEYNKRVHQLKAAVHQYAIPHELYVRVRKHYHYMWNCGVDTAKEILADKALSVGLRRQMAFSFYGNWLRKVSFFANSQEALLQRLAECVDTECFSPEDPIIVAGESGTELYFLVVGRVMIITRQGKLVRVLEEGSFFGEMGLLFPETARTVNVVAHTFGWMLVISREALEDICSDEMMDVFKTVAQERFTYNPGTGVGKASVRAQMAPNHGLSTKQFAVETSLPWGASTESSAKQVDSEVTENGGSHAPVQAETDSVRSVISELKDDDDSCWVAAQASRTEKGVKLDGMTARSSTRSANSVDTTPTFQSSPTIATAATITPHDSRNLTRQDSRSCRVRIKVSIVGASNLRNADIGVIGGLSDPYCICRLKHRPDSEWKTHTVTDSLNPTWNCSMNMPACGPDDILEFDVFDKDNMKNDDFLGRATIPGTLFLPDGYEARLPLMEESSTLAARDLGNIHVQVTVVEVLVNGVHRKPPPEQIRLSSKLKPSSGLPKTYKSPARKSNHMPSRSPRMSRSTAAVRAELGLGSEQFEKFENLTNRLEVAISTWGGNLERRLDFMEDALSDIVKGQQRLDEKLERCIPSACPVQSIEGRDQYRSESPTPLN